MTAPRFDANALARVASDALTARRVLGEPYEHEGRLVVPVARVTGTTWTGSSRHGGDDGNDGGGGGFVTHARPLGVYLVDADGARWQPAIDLDRAILGGQVVGALLGCAWALAWALRRRR